MKQLTLSGLTSQFISMSVFDSLHLDLPRIGPYFKLFPSYIAFQSWLLLLSETKHIITADSNQCFVVFCSVLCVGGLCCFCFLFFLLVLLFAFYLNFQARMM